MTQPTLRLVTALVPPWWQDLSMDTTTTKKAERFDIYLISRCEGLAVLYTTAFDHRFSNASDTLLLE